MHLDEGTIHAWLDGALDAEEAKRVERHAAECGTCRAAVAEARGLIAGASRILSALDDVPSGVVPNSPAFGGAGRAGGPGRQRPRSLWNILHFTPTRAAAAALILVAAGTALVLRIAPNEHGQFETTRLVTDSVRRSRPLSVPASPAPAAAADSASVKVAERMDAKSAPRPARAADLPVPVVAEAQAGRAGHAEKKLDKVSVAQAPAAAMADSTSMLNRDAVIRDSASRAIQSETRRASVASVGGAVPSAALPPAASKDFRAVTQLVGLDFSGCYEVVGGTDSTMGLPRRLSLDTTRFERRARPALALQRSASAGNISQSERYAISALTSEGRRPVEHAYWQATGGGARVTIENPTPRTIQISVRSDSISSLADVAVSSTRTENSELSVTLRRVSCPPQ